ncbi:PD-(D/E)XK nuclease family protein, partial [Bacteroides sp. Phil13]|uniref:PD-(D/E)XK nuclease family protein n=1 Tax=Bacteroides sp. Phil13 TaxID=1929999 RepID=UPI00257ADAD6
LREMLGQAPLGLYYFNANPGYVTKETPILEGVTLDGESIKDIDSRFNDINYKESKIIKATRKGDKIDYNSIDEKNLQALEKYAFDISSQALRQMAEGNIKTSPTEKSCEFCKYRAICLYNANDGCRIISSKKQEDLLKEDDQDE